MTESLRLTLAEILQHTIETEAAARRRSEGLKPGVRAPDRTAVIGRDGQFFIGLGTNQWERQYVGEVAATEGWLDEWTRVLTVRQGQAIRRGVELWNIVVPEKQVVLPHARWENPPSDSARPLARLLPRLSPAQRVFYPVEALKRAEVLGPSYFVRNSHWTPFGCLSALRSLLAAMGVSVEIDSLRFAYEVLRTSHDLPGHFYKRPRTVRAGLLAANGRYTFEVRPYPEVGRYAGTMYGIHNPDAPLDRRVIIFGDSFSYDAGLAAGLSAVFGTVVFIWSKDVDWAAVAAHQADLVIWESAERFLATLPKS